jgi:uncharacterized membrane protein
MNVGRILKHLCTPAWTVKRVLNAADLKAIEEAVRAGETAHRGEVRFAVEGALDPGPLLRGQTPRERALDAFSDLRVWDTAENSGVLIYLLLADREVEIVADRGIHARVGQAAWEEICKNMEAAFKLGQFRAGVLEGVRAVSTLLAREFPSTGANPNELPDAPTVIR